MIAVYLLWREATGWDDQPELESVHATIEGAARAHLNAAHPLAGPRGGKRPTRPFVTWSNVTWVKLPDKPSTPDPNYWQPDDGSDYGIERREVQA